MDKDLVLHPPHPPFPSSSSSPSPPPHHPSSSLLLLLLFEGRKFKMLQSSVDLCVKVFHSLLLDTVALNVEQFPPAHNNRVHHPLTNASQLAWLAFQSQVFSCWGKVKGCRSTHRLTLVSLRYPTFIYSALCKHAWQVQHGSISPWQLPSISISISISIAPPSTQCPASDSPKPLISSVKTPGSLSIRHHSPALPDIFTGCCCWLEGTRAHASCYLLVLAWLISTGVTSGMRERTF